MSFKFLFIFMFSFLLIACGGEESLEEQRGSDVTQSFLSSNSGKYTDDTYGENVTRTRQPPSSAIFCLLILNVAASISIEIARPDTALFGYTSLPSLIGKPSSQTKFNAKTKLSCALCFLRTKHMSSKYRYIRMSNFFR